MQYIVHVSGEAATPQTKTYIINSPTKEDAQLMAVEEFQEEFCVLGDSVYASPKCRTKTAIFAMIFMLIPIFLSLIPWHNGRDIISISPDLTSCIYGILLYTAFVVRFKTISRTVSTWIDIVFAILSVLMLASFIKIISTDETLRIFGLEIVTIKTNILIPIAVLLTWMGLPVVSFICISTVCVLALFNITNLSDAMGALWGSTYTIFAFIGIMLYLSIEPAATETMGAIKQTAQNALLRFKSDSLNAKKNVIKLVDSKKTTPLQAPKKEGEQNK